MIVLRCSSHPMRDIRTKEPHKCAGCEYLRSILISLHGRENFMHSGIKLTTDQRKRINQIVEDGQMKPLARASCRLTNWRGND